MRGRDLAHDREAEPAAGPRGPGHAVEALEDPGALQHRNARPVVFDFEEWRAVPVRGRRAHGDPAAFRDVFEGVVQQVAECLAQQERVALHRRAAELEAEVDVALQGAGAGAGLESNSSMDSVDIEVLRTAQKWRAAGHRAALGTIVKTWGSAPRPVGAMVAVRDDGQIVGSVSGGCVEDDLVEKTKRLLEKETPQILTYGVTNEEATRWGLPCGGTLQLVVEPLGEQSGIPELLERIGARELVRRRLDMKSGRATLESGRWQDTLEFDGATLSSVHGPRWRLVLIGAGQLTRYLAEMAHMLDYHVTVVDPREEYANGWDLAGVPLDRGMPDDVVREMNLDGHSAVVALTHDPKLDDLALMEALKSAALYVGAIGSKKNNDARRERLKEFDVSAAEIARLRGPVGLYIGSKTPPEIAVAILAEMTAVRHGVSEPSWAAKPERRFDPSACEVKQS